MIPEKIPPLAPNQNIGLDDLWCRFGERWIIDVQLAYKLGKMAYDLSTGNDVAVIITIISGWRDAQKQASLPNGAPDHLSTHRSCPATGADIWTNVEPTRVVKALVGAAGIRAGLRWGGGSRVDSQTGIPVDWNHFDLGRRVQ